MGSSHELVLAKKIGGEVCNKMFRDFPNSVDNLAICDKVESEGKKLDWLQKNQDLCSESRDFLNNFMSKSCGAFWCDFADSQRADWSEEASSCEVGGRQGVYDHDEDSTPIEIKRRCKTIRNKLKAVEFLKCKK